MAGPWRKLYANAREHPKIKRLAHALAIPRREAMGCMATLWCWAVEFAPDGDLSDHSEADIEIAADWPGEPGKFIAAAVTVGLLDREEHGIVVHNNAASVGSYGEAKRKAERRAKKKMSQDRLGTNGGLSRDNHTNVPRQRPLEKEKERTRTSAQSTSTPATACALPKPPPWEPPAGEPFDPWADAPTPAAPPDLEHAEGDLDAPTIERILCARWSRVALRHDLLDTVLRQMGRTTLPAVELRRAVEHIEAKVGKVDPAQPGAQQAATSRRLEGLLRSELCSPTKPGNGRRDGPPPPLPADELERKRDEWTLSLAIDDPERWRAIQASGAEDPNRVARVNAALAERERERLEAAS